MYDQIVTDIIRQLRVLKEENATLRRLFEDAVPELIEVARMPNAEHEADAHNAAVCKLRAALDAALKNEPSN